jgi:hypothetical protein
LDTLSERSTREMMTAPDKNGTPALPKRTGSRGMLPSTWISRTLRVEYVGGAGDMRESTAILLDFYPAGPILSIAGQKTCVCWERLVLAALVED